MKRKSKIGKVMGEYKRGKLRSSSGKKVTSKDQAMAIAMSKARRGKKMAEGGPVQGTQQTPQGGSAFNVSQLASMLQSGGLGQAQMADVLRALQTGAATRTSAPSVKKPVMAAAAPQAPKAFRGGGKVTRDGCVRKGRTKGRYI